MLVFDRSHFGHESSPFAASRSCVGAKVLGGRSGTVTVVDFGDVVQDPQGGGLWIADIAEPWGVIPVDE